MYFFINELVFVFNYENVCLSIYFIFSFYNKTKKERYIIGEKTKEDWSSWDWAICRNSKSKSVQKETNDELHSSFSIDLRFFALLSLSLSLSDPMDALVAQLQMQYRNYTVSLYQQVCFIIFPQNPFHLSRVGYLNLMIPESMESLNL